MNMTLEQAHRLAARIVVDWIGDWPEDTWLNIGDDWSLNVYGGDDGKGATLHPVIDGKTDTSVSYPLL